MPLEKVPIAAIDMRPEDVDAVAAVLRSGNLRQGKVTAAFEEAFATRVGARFAVAVSSGTAALHLAYLTFFKPGEEVIVPAFTFVATASMLTAMGAVPVFCDIDPRTFTLHPRDVEAKLTARTRGVVGVHLFGNTCDVSSLTTTARENDLHVIWDAAQALGTKFDGTDVGGFPHATCFSLYPTKNITTGEGGVVATDDLEVATRLRLLRSHGATGKYRHELVGFNYRITDFQAALGLRQLARLDEYVKARQTNAAYLNRYLADLPGITTPFVPQYSSHSFNHYSILIDPAASRMNREQLAGHLAELGIETAVHYPRPLHRQPIYTSTGQRLPVSESTSDRILSLPIHPLLSRAQTERVARAMRKLLSPTARNL